MRSLEDGRLLTGGAPRLAPQVEDEVIDLREPAQTPITLAATGRKEASRAWKKVRLAIAATDVFCAMTALLAAYVLRFGAEATTISYFALLATTPLWWTGVFHAASLYNTEDLSAPEEFRRILGATSIGIMVVIMASYWTVSELSRIWVGAAWIIALLLEFATRQLWRMVIARKRQTGALSFKTLIIGNNREAEKLKAVLHEPSSGFDPVGTFPALGNDVSALGQENNGMLPLREMIRSTGAECLVVASSAVSDGQMSKVIQTARREGIPVKISANLPGILPSRLTFLPIGDVVTVSMRSVRLTGMRAVVKRTFDVCVSSSILVLAAPLWIAIALFVKLSSRGPALFKQERITKEGRAFQMYKFRTMFSNADEILRARNIDHSSPFFKLGEDDPRLTKVGRLLRRYSLDEIPQLLNVLKGDMSLVGPRPLPSNQVAANLDLLGPRHEVPAGMTGWWQVKGRSDVGPDEAVRLDHFYIENWSLTLDLFIMLKTIGAVARRSGAY